MVSSIPIKYEKFPDKNIEPIKETLTGTNTPS